MGAGETGSVYKVRRAVHPIRACVTVPGSKSVTNRALFMAAMACGHTVLDGALFSDDSRHFIGSLEALGYMLLSMKWIKGGDRWAWWKNT